MSQVTITSPRDWQEHDLSLAARLGMWIFLATEILFFGGIFCAYAVLRYLNPVGFGIGGHETEILYGALNTFVLATSAVTMTMAAKAADGADYRLIRIGLIATFALGVLFLALKGMEYHDDIVHHLVPGHHFALADPSAEMFWGFYWVLTGLHAIHMSVGLVIIGRAYWLTRQNLKLDELRRNLDVSSLYWHLVDCIWFVIFPVIYLAGRSG